MLVILVVFLIAGIGSASATLPLQCILLNPLLSILPTDLKDAFANLGTQCSLESCGQVGGAGYFDLYCNFQCMVAGYETGTCSRNLAQGWAKCTCSGVHPGPLPQSTPAVCAILGACACQTCSNGASPPVKYTGGDCFNNPDNTVGVQCKLPQP